jgi:hypothetical protein
MSEAGPVSDRHRVGHDAAHPVPVHLSEPTVIPGAPCQRKAERGEVGA